MLYPEIEDWVPVDTFTHMPSVSHYNSNYYVYKWRLLYGKSDDDYTTDWYIIRGDYVNYLWQSYIDISLRVPSKPETLHRMETMPS